jgi:hypothetical protein
LHSCLYPYSLFLGPHITSFFFGLCFWPVFFGRCFCLAFLFWPLLDPSATS